MWNCAWVLAAAVTLLISDGGPGASAQSDVGASRPLEEVLDELPQAALEADPAERLERAVHAGDLEGVRALVAAGAAFDPLSPGWDHWMATGLSSLPEGRFMAEDGDLLDRAVDSGDGEMFDLVAANGLDPLLRRARTRAGVRARSVVHERALRAAWRGHMGILKRLLAASESLEERLSVEAPMLAAAAAGHDQVYEALLARATPRELHGAAAMGRVEDLVAVLSRSATDLLYRDVRCGLTPLGWAVLMEHDDAVDFLLERGADPDERICSGVERAKWEGMLGTEMPTQENRDSSILAAAVRREHWGIAQALVAKGAPVGAPGLRALMMCRRQEATVLLRDAGARGQVLNQEPEWAFEALGVLLRTGLARGMALERFDLLMDLGASTSLSSTTERPLLKGALWRTPNPELVIALRDAGAPVPPEVAVVYGWASKVESRGLLAEVDHGAIKSLLHSVGTLDGVAPTQRILQARPDLPGEIIVHAIGMAAGKGRLDLIDFLRTRAPSTYDYLSDPDVIVRAAKYPELLRVLLERGADPRGMRSRSLGPLDCAAHAAKPESVRLLLAAGIPADTRTGTSGLTPLSFMKTAVENANWRSREDDVIECIRLLLEAGADPLAKDKVGRVTLERLMYSAMESGLEERILDTVRPHMDVDQWVGNPAVLKELLEEAVRSASSPPAGSGAKGQASDR